ncbi:DUF6602 domain-containing protein [Vitreimonas sp.]|uniref:DUF6602 domain-containing protein n=1 Tax=Vitreimonas sp. TaxID=3069702 RepID=UPI002ED807F5
MLKAHLDAVERHLLSISQIPANAGHTLHRGTPREAFIREFLQGHLSARLAVGTGEIIDAQSQPRQQRNQFDIVIYKNDYPRIDLGGGINAFLAESVVATIEVKSVLTAAEIDNAIGAASTAKRLQRNLITAFTSGYVPPGILSYVVAYDGPAQASTVHGWIKQSETTRGLNNAPLPQTRDQRAQHLSESLEGVFVLGKHSVLYDNSPLSLLSDATLAQNSTLQYSLLDQLEGNLLLLFLLLTQAGTNTTGQWADLIPYVAQVRMNPSFSV